MKRKRLAVTAIAAVCLLAAFLLWPPATPDSALPATQKARAAQQTPIERLKDAPPADGAAAQPVRQGESLRDRLLRYLDRVGRTPETLAFAASQFRPVDPGFLEEARKLDPDSPFVAAMDIQATRQGQHSSTDLDVKALLDALVLQHPENGYYQRMLVDDVLRRRDWSSLASTSAGIPPEFADGNLTRNYRARAIDFMTHENGMTLRASVTRSSDSDGFTPWGPDSTAQMISFELERAQVAHEAPLPGSVEIAARTIGFLQQEGERRDDIRSLTEQLEAEVRLVKAASALDPDGFGSYLSVPLPQYQEGLQQDLTEAKQLKKSLQEFLETASDAEVAQYSSAMLRDGQLTTLRQMFPSGNSP